MLLASFLTVSAQTGTPPKTSHKTVSTAAVAGFAELNAIQKQIQALEKKKAEITAKHKEEEKLYALKRAVNKVTKKEQTEHEARVNMKSDKHPLRIIASQISELRLKEHGIRTHYKIGK